MQRRFNTVLAEAEKFQTRFQQESQKTDDKEILKASESRYRSNPDYPDQAFGNYDDQITRKEFDLSVTFKAPHYGAHDYWRNKQDYDNRRTIFDYSFGAPDKTTAFPDFYQIMTSIFGGRDEVSPESPQRYHYPRNPVTPPYSYDPPFNFRPTEPNYIPPPKPIRASVIKLETITRSPLYPSFEYETTQKYYPHPGSILNHVLIENSKAQQNLDFHPREPKIPSFKPLPVLPPPDHVLPTTLKPMHPRFYNNHTQNLFKYYNETDYKYPESVQDQLPHFNLGEVKIPYVSEKSIPQIFNTLSTEPSPQAYSAYNGDFFPLSNSRTTTKVLGLNDIRSFNSPGSTPGRRERPDFDTTTVKSFPGAVEKVKRPTFKYTKKVTAQLDKSSVERVANLTVQGFSKPDKENLNARKQVNYFNVKDLIDYERGRLENVSQTFSEPKQTTTISRSSKHPVNLNDEFSLDAKILKDTNWDGLTVFPTLSTTETAKKTTTFLGLQTTQPKPRRNKTAFWEIVDGQTTTTLETTTEATTATESTKIQTTTEFTPWPSTPETSEFVTTEEGTTQKITEARRRAEKLIDQSITENPETLNSTTQPERTAPVRRYTRRPKVVNFTPYPTAEEVQKKLINRNHFPKRQKPNITLAFGNKNVLKNRNNFEKEDVMNFSDEDVRKRRKTGKRRQVIKRIRVATS